MALHSRYAVTVSAAVATRSRTDCSSMEDRRGNKRPYQPKHSPSNGGYPGDGEKLLNCLLTLYYQGVNSLGLVRHHKRSRSDICFNLRIEKVDRNRMSEGALTFFQE